TSDGAGTTAAINVAENSTAVTTVTATDADLPADTLTYSITGGADAAKFSIDSSSGVLTFASAPDFETPTDTDTDNVYEVTVEVTDGTLTDSQDISVTVTPLNDNTPTITSDGAGPTAAIDVSENSSLATVVTATDADLPAESLSYSITGGADAARFLIDSSSGVLQFVAPPDYETPIDAGNDNVYDVIVQVTDGTFSDTQAIAVTILNASEVATSFADTAIWRSSGVTAPIAATWDGSSFGTAEKTVTVGQWRIIDGAESPSRDEKIVVGVSSAGVISGEMYSGGSWSALPFSLASGASSGEHGFDVVYESVSGNALLVWNNGSTGTNSVSYRTWDGTSWSAEQTATAPLSGRATQIKLVSDPNSDSVIMLVTTSSSDDYAIVWDGNSWGTGSTLGTTSGQTSDSAVAIESLSGQGLAIYDDVAGGTELDYRVWNGSTWSAASTLNPPAGITGDPRFVITASDPLSDRIALAALTSSNEIWFSIWDGSTWTSSITASTNASTSSSISMAVSFESETGQLLATYAESGNTTVSYLTWTSAGGWSAASSTPSIGGVPNSMTLSSDVDTDRIMLAVQDSNSDLHYVQWDGSSWGAVNTLDLDTGETSAQPFLFLYDASTNVDPAITSNGAGASASINVAENSTAVTTVIATDTDLPAQTLNFSITGGADASQFSINSVNGTLRFISAPDREAPTDAGSNNVYDVIV
ncbi:MAG: cadherin repeat domain-containing protein, partial [Rhodopirellula sp.]|nr:cadherin repeat domain-containing protein [Rhodopirellula sp.]